MSTKVRIEWVTLTPLGAVSGASTDQPAVQYGVQELTATGGTPVSSSYAPYFGLLNGLHITNGIARVSVIQGAAIVAAGLSPAPSETSGERIEAGAPAVDIPVQTGWLVAIIEAADPVFVPGGGAVSDSTAESELGTLNTTEAVSSALLSTISTAISSSNTALGGVNTALALLETHADAVTSNTTLSALQTALGLVATHADETTANTALAAIQTALGLLETHTDASSTNTGLATINTSLASLATHGDLVTTNADLVGIKGDLDAAATAAGQATAHTDVGVVEGDITSAGSQAHTDSGVLASDLAAADSSLASLLTDAGAQSDAAANNSTSSWSMVALLKGILAKLLGTLNTVDANGAAFGGEVAMTPGTAYAAGRSLKVICTSAGDVAVTYPDSSIGIWAAQVGTQTFPIAVTAVNVTGTTAVGSFFNLK